MKSATLETSDHGTVSMDIDKTTVFRAAFNRRCQVMEESAQDGDCLTSLEIVAVNNDSSGVHEWQLQTYVNSKGDLIVSARWRDAHGDYHNMPVKQYGFKDSNVAVWLTR